MAGTTKTFAIAALGVSVALWTAASMNATSAHKITAPGPSGVWGRLVDADTRQPLRGVEISLDDDNWRKTDEDGSFAFTGLESGKRRLQVGSPFTSSFLVPPIEVLAGDRVETIEYPARLVGTVQGTVRVGGHGLAGVTVLAMVAEFTRTGMTTTRQEVAVDLSWIVHAATTTDASGAYRLERLRAGLSYSILAVDARKLQPGSDVVAPAFFPSSRDAATARLIKLVSNETRQGIDIAMTRVESACVSGRLLGRQSQAQVPIRLEPITVEAVAEYGVGSQVPWYQQSTKSVGGEFKVCGVAHGDYTVWAGESAPRVGGPIGMARVRVDRDLSGISIVMKEPVEVLARFLTPGRNAGSLQPLKMSPWPPVEVQAQEANRFVMTLVPYQRHSLLVDGLGESEYVADVRFLGRSIMSGPLRPDPDSQNHLEIDVRGDGATVEITTVGENRVVPFCYVFMVPTDVQTDADIAMRTVSRRTDLAGKVTVSGLRPGRLAIVAIPGLVPSAAHRPTGKLWVYKTPEWVASIRSAMAATTGIDLRPNDRKTVSIPITNR